MHFTSYNGERAGHPTSVTTNEIVSKNRNSVLHDRSLKVWQFARTATISMYFVHHVGYMKANSFDCLTEHFPRLDGLYLFQRNPAAFFGCFITVNITRIYRIWFRDKAIVLNIVKKAPKNTSVISTGEKVMKSGFWNLFYMALLW